MRQALGSVILEEIAKQDMIVPLPEKDHTGRVVGFHFRWKGNAGEQLEAVIDDWFAQRQLYLIKQEMLRSLPPGHVPDLP